MISKRNTGNNTTKTKINKDEPKEEESLNTSTDEINMFTSIMYEIKDFKKQNEDFRKEPKKISQILKRK